MNRAFEVQLIDNVRNATRKRPRVEPAIVMLNMTALVIGLIGVSIGYALSNVRPEAMLQIFQSIAM